MLKNNFSSHKELWSPDPTVQTLKSSTELHRLNSGTLVQMWDSLISASSGNRQLIDLLYASAERWSPGRTEKLWPHFISLLKIHQLYVRLHPQRSLSHIHSTLRLEQPQQTWTFSCKIRDEGMVIVTPKFYTTARALAHESGREK